VPKVQAAGDFADHYESQYEHDDVKESAIYLLRNT
jgi:hypothetical protein